MPDKFGWDNNFGNNPTTSRHKRWLDLHAFDVCDCGDYRRQHVNGTGRCNLGSLCTPGHCAQFRLNREAVEVPTAYR